MIDYSLIEKEVQIADDECCIIFDFGCYFPYSNAEVLTFDFRLGKEEFTDKKINHRYPNRHYQTISKKYGRKVSRIGYPYIMKIDEQTVRLITIKVGTHGNYFEMVIPFLTKMTKDNPICVLSLHFLFDEMKFVFTSPERIEKGYWHIHNWYSYEVDEANKGEFDVILNPPKRIGDSFVITYEDTLTPYPMPIKM